jgi:soluble lytic murein transglycosylase-like protein
MQLMPNTARRYRKVSSEQLHLPSLNVDIGTAHLRWLERKVKARFPDARTSDKARIQLIAAGYNAGWRRVLQHWGVPPYQETRIYVRRVWRLYRRFSAPGSA